MRRLYLFFMLIFSLILLPAYIYGDTIYTVKKGDSLYKISKKFGVSIRELKRENNLASKRIKPGLKLHIPEKGRVHKETLKSVVNTKTVKKENRSKKTIKKEGASEHYIVKKHDTLEKIAKNNSVTVREIKEINSLKTTKIRPGQKLILCRIKSDEQPKKPDAIISEPPSEKDSKKDQFYIVKRGDTLASISRIYSVSVDELKEFNHLSSTKLKVGQQLIIKRGSVKTYEVRKGDNLFRIARRFNIELDELKRINNLETDALKPAQIILLEPEQKVEKTVSQDEQIKADVNEMKETKEVSVSEDLSNLGIREKLILFAKKMMDIPYRFGGNSIFGIDCSGFVQKVYGMIGINLPRSARLQFAEGKPIDKTELSIGDLVFFKTYAPFPSHVGIYLGNDLFIHASSIKKKVTIDSLTTPFYFKRFIGAKRVIQNSELDKTL